LKVTLTKGHPHQHKTSKNLKRQKKKKKEDDFVISRKGQKEEQYLEKKNEN